MLLGDRKLSISMTYFRGITSMFVVAKSYHYLLPTHLSAIVFRCKCTIKYKVVSYLSGHTKVYITTCKAQSISNREN